jgi:chorismate mutase/prephenate dehydratase
MSKRPPQSSPKAKSKPKRARAAENAAGNDPLGELRGKIGSVDERIQRLIAERARYAKEIGVIKGLTSTVEFFRPEREAQVLRMVVERNDGPLRDEEMVRLLRELMSACLAQEEPLKVAYLGPEGTFTQSAVLKHFGHSARGLPLGSVEEVFEELEAGHADFGVVPVENSGQGTIQSTLDMFLTSNLRICGEVELHVHQVLLSRTGRLEDIERVYSHAMSLAQCKAWLRQHLPKAEKLAVGAGRCKAESPGAGARSATATAFRISVSMSNNSRASRS